MSKGHPKGLYPLFFTEMWERLAFYLMVGILVLYAADTERGGLGLTISQSTEIFGTYLAFVYFTPFMGGMLADRWLGFRRAIALGGVLMAAGFFLLGVRSLPTFYAGLTFLCLGNGFFKPNISAMVGNLYQPGDPRRDAGFNIFYMGINIGASVSALLSAPLRNLWDFNTAFIAAGVGLLIGVSVLVFNWKKLAPADVRSEPSPDDVSLGTIALTILLPAGIFGLAGYFIGANVTAIRSSIGPITFAFLVGVIPVVFYFVVLIRRATPDEKPGLNALMPVYIAGGTFFMILHLSGGLLTFFTEQNTNREGDWIPSAMSFYSQKAMPSYFTNAAPGVPRPDERTLLKVDKRFAAMFGARRLSDEALDTIQKRHGDVKIIATDDKAYDRTWGRLTCKIFAAQHIQVATDKDSHGHITTSVRIKPETAKPLRKVAFVREIDGRQIALILVTEATFTRVYTKASKIRLEPGTLLGLYNAELVTGLFNPVFVVFMTPVVVAFFAWRVRRKRPISTARKIFWGMVLTTVALGVMAWGSYMGGDGESKVSVAWLVSYYLIITFGELCLSPMGLSLVTKLSPKRLVGLMMGGWFLSTAIGNKLSGFISGLPATAMMFVILGLAVLGVAAFIFVLLPRLDRALDKYGA